jgi:hypothetical protein
MRKSSDAPACKVQRGHDGKGPLMSAKILHFRKQPLDFPNAHAPAGEGADAVEKRRAIIWAAIEALEAGGGATCSIEEIERRVGLEASEVIRLFGDQDAVLAAAFRELSAWANASWGCATTGQGDIPAHPVDSGPPER